MRMKTKRRARHEAQSQGPVGRVGSVGLSPSLEMDKALECITTVQQGVAHDEGPGARSGKGLETTRRSGPCPADTQGDEMSEANKCPACGEPMVTEAGRHEESLDWARREP
jgi:hypothetical protein